MATLIQVPTGRTGYAGIVRTVIAHGTARDPRGMPTLDLGHTTIELDSPYNALPVGVGRNLSRRVAAAEAVQLLGGFSDPDLLFAASANFRNYVEPDGRFWGAYGIRISDQLWRAYDKLVADPDTRQAVLTLWNPLLDNQRGKRDYPCTLSIVFSRGPKLFLEMDVTMRSNDVWRGLPYDLFQFSQLQLTLARALGWEPGRYRHHAHSLHLYLSDLDAAEVVASELNPPQFVEELPTGFGSGKGRECLSGAIAIANTLPYSTGKSTTLTESESWYWHVLRGQLPELTYATN